MALQLREKYQGRVTAMSLGPRRAERELREALAMGCDDAVLLSDAAFAGSDTLATSYALSQAVRHLCEMDNGRPFDLVICGVRATDGETGRWGRGWRASWVWFGRDFLPHVSSIQGSGFRGAEWGVGGWGLGGGAGKLLW